MLVGNKHISDKELLNHCTSPAALLSYVNSLIPAQVKHVHQIVANQKYLVATHVRNLTSLPYTKKRALCSALLSGVRVCGVCNELYDYVDLIGSVNTDEWEALEDAERRAGTDNR